MTVRLSALRAGRPLPPGRFLVLISIRGWVHLRATLRLEWLDKLKNSTSSGLEPANFRIVPGASTNYATPPPHNVKEHLRNKISDNNELPKWDSNTWIPNQIQGSHEILRTLRLSFTDLWVPLRKSAQTDRAAVVCLVMPPPSASIGRCIVPHKWRITHWRWLCFHSVSYTSPEFGFTAMQVIVLIFWFQSYKNLSIYLSIYGSTYNRLPNLGSFFSLLIFLHSW
jgi:hypothetical protein